MGGVGSPGREGRVSQGACALLVCRTLPNHKALLGAPLPTLIAIRPAIGVVISTETRSQGRASTGPNLILPFPKAVPSGHLGANGASLHPRSLPSPLLPQLPL